MQSPSISVADVISALYELKLANSTKLHTYKDFRVPKTGDTVLHIAASIGIPEAIFFAHSLELDINARNKAGETPLHLAVVEDNLELVDALLENGADVNCKTECGQTVLHYAVIFLSNESLNRIVYRGGIDFLIQDSVGWTALHYSAVNANLDVIKLLLSMEPKLLETVSALGVSILHLLSLSNSAIICQNGAPNVTYTISFIYDPNNKHIHDSKISKQAFLSEGSSTTETKTITMPINMNLAYKSSTVVIQYSPTLLVTNEDYERCIRWLLMDFIPALTENNINIDVLFGRDTLGRTPLHYAAFMGSYRSLYTIVSYIHLRIKQCYQANRTGSCLSLMKHSAVNDNNISCSISPFIVAEGGVGFEYFAHPDNAGLSPLQLACMSGIAASKLKLLSTICDVTTYTQALGNALHCAIRSGSLQTVSELVGVISRMMLLKNSGEQSTFLLDFLIETDYSGATSFALVFKGNRTVHQIHAFITEYNKLVLLLDQQSLLLFLAQVNPLRLLIKATSMTSRKMSHTYSSESEECVIDEIFAMMFNWLDRVSVDMHCLLFPTGIFQNSLEETLATRKAYEILNDFVTDKDKAINTLSLESLAVSHLRGWANEPTKDKSHLIYAIEKDKSVYSAVLQILKSYSVIVMRQVKQAYIKNAETALQIPSDGIVNTVKAIEEQYTSILSELQEFPKQANVSKTLMYETADQILASNYFLDKRTHIYAAILSAPPLIVPIVDAIIYNNKIALMLILSNIERTETISKIGAKYGNTRAGISLKGYLSLISSRPDCNSGDDDIWRLLSGDIITSDENPISDLFSRLHLSFATLWKGEMIMNAIIVSILTNNYAIFCILCSLMPPTHYRCDVLLFLLGTIALAKFEKSSKVDFAINDKYERVQNNIYKYIEFILDHLVSVPSARIALSQTTIIAGTTNLLKDLFVFSSPSTSLDDYSLRGVVKNILPLIMTVQERLVGRKLETPMLSHTPVRLGPTNHSNLKQIPFLALLILRGQSFGQGILKYTSVFTQLDISYTPDLNRISSPKKAANTNTTIWHYFSSESYSHLNGNQETLYPVPELFRRAVKNLVVTYGIEQNLFNKSSIYSMAKAMQLRVNDRCFITRMDDITKRTKTIKTMKLFEGHRYNRNVINGKPPNPRTLFGASMIDVESVEDMTLSTSNHSPFYIYEDGTSNISLILSAITSAVMAWIVSLRYKLEFIYERMRQVVRVLSAFSIEVSYDDVKIMQLLCLIRLKAIGHASVGDVMSEDEHGLTPLETAVRYGSPTTLILLLLHGGCFNVQSAEPPSLSPFASIANKVEAQMIKRIEAACISKSPAALINALHILLTISTFNPSFIKLLTRFKINDTKHNMFTPAHANVLQPLLERCPMKLQFITDPSPIDNIVCCYLVNAKVTSIHNIISSKTIGNALHEWSLLRSAGTGSLCHVCNRERSMIGRLISETYTCASCGRTLCSWCVVSLGKVQKHSLPCVVCASCYVHRICPRLLNLQID